jgi:hypothetical protein
VKNDKKSKGEKMAETGPVAGGVVSPNRLRHVMMAAAVGSALEWYDFFIYGTASALVFGDLASRCWSRPSCWWAVAPS